jgi:hypothetical protein
MLAAAERQHKQCDPQGLTRALEFRLEFRAVMRTRWHPGYSLMM